MLTANTVFVVGAGASSEVGLPLGTTLKNTIAAKLDLRFEFFDKPVGKGDLTIFNMLRTKYLDEINLYLGACGRIRDGIPLADSIDDYIETHQTDEKAAICGKLAIASSILEAERSSPLFYERKNMADTINFDHTKIASSWYPAFFSLVRRGITKANLDSIFDKVKIISFNYDRCIEHFLVHAVASVYHISIDDSMRLVKDKLNIFHPYGTVGSYFGNSSETVSFGFKGIPPLDGVIRNLKTYSENIKETSSLHMMRQSIQDAEVVVFLGNAYHAPNMSLLAKTDATEEPLRNTVKRVYATRHGIPDESLGIITQRINGVCMPDPQTGINVQFAGECKNLLDRYGLQLAE